MSQLLFEKSKKKEKKMNGKKYINKINAADYKT